MVADGICIDTDCGAGVGSGTIEAFIAGTGMDTDGGTKSVDLESSGCVESIFTNSSKGKREASLE